MQHAYCLFYIQMYMITYFKTFELLALSVSNFGAGCTCLSTLHSHKHSDIKPKVHKTPHITQAPYHR